ncbi:MAG TPA: 16S rRNA (cytosine(1402)-N(4))-methyltransferase RsmH [Candidatus Methylomirabilis sp.]|nr:16S rRNA (cytosine(1402)-N(4))-methyltransferase RsmH [Candidatus Methylomirabilis sp.]
MTTHVAVLTREAIEALQPRVGGTYLDGTLGGGTHAEELLKASAPDGRVLSLDVNQAAITGAKKRLAAYGERWSVAEENFRHLDRVATERGMAPFDGILLDLGFSSDELADPAKGLSFLVDGPLDMRLGPKANEDGLTAAEIVNSWTESEIERVLRMFGEERYARRLAHGVVQARRASRIIGTLDLVAVINASIPSSHVRASEEGARARGTIHPATRTFQALRIVVNDELESLRQAITASASVLRSGGRLAIITFHSLEDRLVKEALSGGDWVVVTKKPITPSGQEVQRNPRSRSAKLRVAEKI